MVEHLLASLQREAGNHDVAPGFDSPVDNIAKLFLNIQVFVFFMSAVAISRLDNYIFRLIENRRVIDYWALRLADIAGKKDPVVFAVLFDIDADGGRPQHMPGLIIAAFEIAVDLHTFQVVHRGQNGG